MDKFRKILTENGIKPTFQRIKIMEYLDRNMTHPTVDMVYKALDGKVPTLSRTTVYNTLDVLQKHGLINVISITNSELRYDSNNTFHHHFLCRKCGQIYDVPVTCQFSKAHQVQGHQIEEIHGYFKGVCRYCAGETVDDN